MDTVKAAVKSDLFNSQLFLWFVEVARAIQALFFGYEAVSKVDKKNDARRVFIFNVLEALQERVSWDRSELQSLVESHDFKLSL